MDETLVRGLLETALGDEPPIGPARTQFAAGRHQAAPPCPDAACRQRSGGRGRRGRGHTSGDRGLWQNHRRAAHRVAVSLPKVPSVPTGTAYVINSGGGTVTPIDLATNTAGKPIDVPGEPVALTAAPDGAAAYVANQPSSTVTPINLRSNKPEKPIKIGSGWDSGFEAIVTVP